MAVWQIVIEKFFNNEYFVNDYHVQESDALNVPTAVGVIANLERAVTPQNVSFTKARYRPAGSSAQGTVMPLGFFGLADAMSNPMPLYCTARVDLAPVSGRVGRKYMRALLNMSSVEQGSIIPATRTFIQTNFVAPLVALGYVCKENGSEFVSGATIAAVQMRQLRRGSKRRLQPII